MKKSNVAHYAERVTSVSATDERRYAERVAPVSAMNFIKEVLEELSFAGCKEIVIKGRTALDRLFWGAWVGVALVLSVLLVWSSWRTFVSDATVTTVTRQRQEKCSVPAVTVCRGLVLQDYASRYFVHRTWGKLANRKRYYMSLLAHVANFSLDNLGGFRRYLLDPSLPSTSFNELQESMRYEDPITSKYEDGFHDKKGRCAHRVVGETGLCYCKGCLYGDDPIQGGSFQVTKEGQRTISCNKMVGWNMQFESLNRSVKFYVHSPFETPLFSRPVWVADHTNAMLGDSWSWRVLISPALHALPASQRKCLFSYEGNLTVSAWYTARACFMQCRSDRAVQLCGCSPHVYYKSRDTCTIEDFPCLHQNMRLLRNMSLCACLPECTSEYITVLRVPDARHTKDQNVLFELRVRNAGWMAYYRDVSYTKLDMIASWGGSVSFFLGASLLSLVEFAYILLRWPCFMLLQLGTWPRCGAACSRLCGALWRLPCSWAVNMPVRVMTRIGRDWLDSTTVHGMKHIAKRNYSRKERVFWILVVLLFFCVSFYVSSELAMEMSSVRYQEVVTQVTTPFRMPATYILPQYVFVSSTRDLQEKLTKVDASKVMFPSTRHYMHPSFVSVHPTTFLRGLQLDMVKEHRNCSANLQRCAVNRVPFPCCAVLELVASESGPCFAMTSMQTAQHEARTLELEKHVGRTGPHQHVTLSLHLAARDMEQYHGAHRILPLQEQEVPFLDNQQKDDLHMYGYRTTSYFKVTNTEVDPEVLALDPEARGCRMPQETLPDSFYPAYGYSTCVAECRAQAMQRLCGCVHLYSPSLGNATTCDWWGLLCLQDHVESLFSSAELGRCSCVPRCDLALITYSGYSREKLLVGTEATMRYSGNSGKVRMSRARDEIDVFVTVGGVFGLFVGSSVLSIVELVFFFTVRFMASLKQELKPRVPLHI